MQQGFNVCQIFNFTFRILSFLAFALHPADDLNIRVLLEAKRCAPKLELLLATVNPFQQQQQNYCFPPSKF